jgi:caa(3)-type oxidase subunit IV
MTALFPNYVAVSKGRGEILLTIRLKEKGRVPMHEGHEPPLGGLKEGVRAKPEKTAEFKPYILTWLGIIILTGVTFTLSRIKIGGWEVIIALLIAGTQSALALYFFMHLRGETARIFKILIPLVLAILVVLMSLTFSDVAFRG